jgi:uncharacterized protein
MKNKTLIIYLIIITILSTGFIVLIKMLGQKGNYLGAFYMMGPAIAAFITRLFFYEKKFKDANLKFGKIKDYLKYWAIAVGISISSFLIFTLLGSIKWDFSGQTFLSQLTQQFALTGKNINDLPPGFTPKIMLVLFFIGGLTIFNIFPGIVTGFGEEFGWRGLMFPQLYRIRPWIAFLIGGMIWYVWHIPLVLVFPQVQSFTLLQTIINICILSIGSICTFTFMAYVYIKSENIFVVSVAHITLDNVARSFSYFVIVQNQIMANLGLTITMLLVVAIIYYSKEWQVFRNYFSKMELGNYS